jgi:integrase/recombinase XerD
MSHAIALPTTAGGLAAMDPLQLATLGFLARYKGRTLEAYTLDLKSYFAWCATNGLQPLHATRPHLELFIRWMEQVPYSTATINRRFNTVALLYKYALRDEIIAKDPAAFIDRPKIDRDGQRRTFLPPLQHGVFMAQAAEQGVMANALACLLGLRGMRVGSACALDVTDISQQQGYDVVTFITKGGKLTTMALPVPAMRAVRAAIGDRTEGPLLLNTRGRRMDRAAATRVVRKIAAAAKVDTDISPHSLRRSFITTGLASGVPARDMQLAAGHAQINTTMIYDRRSHGHDRDAVHRVSGYLAGMSA